MASGRQRRKIDKKKKKIRKKKMEKKTRAATTTKKIVKMVSTPQAVQHESSAARTGSGYWLAVRQKPKRQVTVDEAAPIKKQAGEKHTYIVMEMGRAVLKKACSVCGGERRHEHRESFCTYNYVNGFFGTCRQGCRPGKHPFPGSERRREALRCFVRVSNVPLDLIPGRRELRWLFERFGPLLECDLLTVALQDRVGFGYVTFEDREHAEAAVGELNGHRVGDRRLRVDWAYPRA